MVKYNEPELKVVKMSAEDVLTSSAIQIINAGGQDPINTPPINPPFPFGV
ncbi:MAG: hypothetical protein IJR70_04290 [Eubacterium sp.]|nr:hypothetical protein [Eubacterium sp.]